MELKRKMLSLLLFVFSTIPHVSLHNNDVALNTIDEYTYMILRSFGSFSIDQQLFEYIRSILKDGKTILELGSGWATGQFAQQYTVYSVEHDKNWLNKYDSHYIYAPIKNAWYDPHILEEHLPTTYDLILVDGPIGHGKTNRMGFYTYLYLFKTDVPIIFDDINRPGEYKLITLVAKSLERPFIVYPTPNGKSFGVILPE